MSRLKTFQRKYSLEIPNNTINNISLPTSQTGYLTVYGVGSPGLDPPDGVDDADLAFDLDLLQETRHRTEQTATATTVPINE